MNSILEITSWVAARLDDKHKFNHELIARIESSAWNLRATYLEREINKTGKFPKAAIQNLGLIKMEEVDAAEVCDIEDGCLIWRSKEKIPRPVQIARSDKFEYVGTINSVKRFTLTNDFGFANEAERKFPALTPYYLYRDDYIYSSIKNIKVRGTFEDPNEAAKFNDCDGSDCDTSINSFTPADWIESIRMELVKEFSPFFNNTVNDISAAGDVVQPK